MITFNDVLRSAGVDPSVVRLARHQDTRARGRSIYAIWKSPDGPEPVEQYQAIQKPMTASRSVALLPVSWSPRRREANIVHRPV